MTRYALVTPDDQIYTTKDESRLDLSAGTRTGWRWLPIEEITDDRSTTAEKVAEPVTQTIEASRVLRTRVIRDKTAQEISDEEDARVLSEADQVLGKAIFILLNEVRGLKSQPPVTKQQFLSWMKAQL